MSGSTADTPAQGLPALVWSKLQPPVRRRHVARPALVQLCRRPGTTLVLIRAPAGWGKTTLLADWCSTPEETRPFAWVALDRGDNDPVRFWSYLLHALKAHCPQVGRTSLAALTAPRADVPVDVFPLLFSELTSAQEDVVLVLDDYHLVTNPEIDAALAYLAEYLPACLTLVVASRTEPPLPLARMRGRGQLTEIGAEHLRFTDPEANALLNDLNDLGLSHTTVARLHRRTEGWAAGLYLAALSLRDRTDRDSFVDAFAGDDRHVVDYLSTEVIAGLPGPTKDFLRRTAHLDRLCAELCDAVTQATGSRDLLLDLEASNAFLVPLDNRRQWYRYHHLFAELLRNQLAPADPAERDDLHRRASDWYRVHGFASDAIRHATAAAEHDTAAQLIVDHWIEARDRGRLETLIAWVEALPASVVTADPRLCLVMASTLQEIGRFDAADRWLDRITQNPDLDTVTAGPASLGSGLVACRAINRYFAGDAQGILDLTVTRHHDIAPPDDYWQSALLTTRGAAQFVTGQNEVAAETLHRAATLAQQSRHHLALIHALGWLVVTRTEDGRDLPGAQEALETIEALLVDHPELAPYYGTAMAHVSRGALALHRGPAHVHQAEAELRRGVELARRGSARLEEGYALILLSQAMTATGDGAAAVHALERARAVLHACPSPGRLLDLASRPGRTTHATSPALPHGQSLSDRELAVLRLLPTTLSQREIGRELYLSFNTVKTHVQNIFRKLDVSTRQDAVEQARRWGVL